MRYFEDVQVGDDLTPLVKEISMARMMAYGAATWDFIRIHYDADYARRLAACLIGELPSSIAKPPEKK